VAVDSSSAGAFSSDPGALKGLAVRPRGPARLTAGGAPVWAASAARRNLLLTVLAAFYGEAVAVLAGNTGIFSQKKVDG
jgi:hypothetical protein